ncbi:MAG: hypothetical protein ABC612_03585 [Candidatus Methanosuratincola petrocarbonis]|nr:hypothetical protein [Candidatus Methanosuratincola sp.]
MAACSTSTAYDAAHLHAAADKRLVLVTDSARLRDRTAAMVKSNRGKEFEAASE